MSTETGEPAKAASELPGPGAIQAAPEVATEAATSVAADLRRYFRDIHIDGVTRLVIPDDQVVDIAANSPDPVRVELARMVIEARREPCHDRRHGLLDLEIGAALRVVALAVQRAETAEKTSQAAQAEATRQTERRRAAESKADAPLALGYLRDLMARPAVTFGLPSGVVAEINSYLDQRS